MTDATRSNLEAGNLDACKAELDMLKQREAAAKAAYEAAPRSKRNLRQCAYAFARDERQELEQGIARRMGQ